MLSDERDGILVFAPHPDDDAIGCGGTLAMLAAARMPCTVVYVTDGSACHPNSRRFTAAQLARQRETEARVALRHLGVEAAPIFMRETDGTLAALAAAQRTRLVERIRSLVAGIAPSLVFAPWRRDVHDDHVVTSSVVEEAVGRLPFPPRLLFYSVWQPLHGRRDDSPRDEEVLQLCVRLTGEARAKKRLAIAAHRSQTMTLADDEPGFRITPEMFAAWTGPTETFLIPASGALRGGANPLRRAWRFVRRLA
jgi:LmbE family N-acetylglucosaminyl deacetylase